MKIDISFRITGCLPVRELLPHEGMEFMHCHVVQFAAGFETTDVAVYFDHGCNEEDCEDSATEFLIAREWSDEPEIRNVVVLR